MALTLLVTVNQTVLKDELLYSNPGRGERPRPPPAPSAPPRGAARPTCSLPAPRPSSHSSQELLLLGGLRCGCHELHLEQRRGRPLGRPVPPVPATLQVRTQGCPNPEASASAAAGGRWSRLCSRRRGSGNPELSLFKCFVLCRQGVSTERECPSYMARAGTHLGCLLRGLSGFPFRTYFLVNGSSQLGAVQFFDAILSMKDMGRAPAAGPQGAGAERGNRKKRRKGRDGDRPSPPAA